MCVCLYVSMFVCNYVCMCVCLYVNRFVYVYVLYVSRFVCVYIRLLFLDALHFGRQAFKGSSTTHDRVVSILFLHFHPAINYPFCEQWNYPL